MRLVSFALGAFAIVGCSVVVEGRGGEPPLPSIDVAPRWTEPTTSVSRRVLGHNSVWSRGGLGVWDDRHGVPFGEVMAMVRTLSPGVLRFPGGTRAMRYHFDRAIGPIQSREPQCDPFRGTTDATTYGPDEFLRLAESLGADVTLVTPWVDGSPEEAAAFVAYVNADASSKVVIGKDVNGKDWGAAADWAQKRAENGHPAPYRVAFVEIGNEPFSDIHAGPSTSSCGRSSPFKQDERWVNGVAVPTTAKDYASQVAISAAKIRAVDPSIRIAAAAYSAFDGASDATKEVGDADRRLGTGDAWNARLVSDAGGAFDLFVLHPYDFSMTDARLQLAERMRTTMHALRTLDPSKGFAVTEYGFLFGGGTMMNAIVSADVVRVAIEEKATIALRHVLIEDDATEPFADSAEILGATHDAQPSFHVMRLLAETLQNKVVPSTDAAPDVTALATRDENGDALGVVLVDRRIDGGDDPPTPIDLALPAGSFDAKITTLRATSLSATRDDVSLDVTHAQSTETIHVDVPPHGIVFLQLQKTRGQD